MTYLYDRAMHCPNVETIAKRRGTAQHATSLRNRRTNRRQSNDFSTTRRGEKFFALATMIFFVSCMLFGLSDARAQSRGGLGTAEGQTQIKPLKIGDTIPQEVWNYRMPLFTDTLVTDTISLSAFGEAEVLIIDFWPSWCSSCVKTVYELDSIINSNDFKNVKLVSICVYETEERLKAFIKRVGWAIPTLFDYSFMVDTMLSRYLGMYGQVLVRGNRILGAPLKQTLTVENLRHMDNGEWQDVTISYHDEMPRRGGV